MISSNTTQQHHARTASHGSTSSNVGQMRDPYVDAAERRRESEKASTD